MRRPRPSFALLALALIASATLALAQSGLQIAPDGKRTLISKDVGGERWAITLNADDASVTGNVFFPGGGPPQFVWCTALASSPGEVRLRCSGADRCPLEPCSSEDWIFVADVVLPESFFAPPAAARAAGSRNVCEAMPTLHGSQQTNLPSGLQLTPDSARRALISKDVGPERWAITRHPDDGSVTGNVFFPGGGEPVFVWCEETGGAADELTFACFAADPCPAAPCAPDAWDPLATVALPPSFFAPRSHVDVVEVVDAASAAHGLDGGFDAFVLALDRGYSLRQVTEAALTGRLLASGEVARRAGGIEEPDGPPLGLFLAQPASSGASSAVGFTLQEFRDGMKGAARNLNVEIGTQGEGLWLLLSLHAQGYSPEQIIEGLLLDNVRVALFAPGFAVPFLVDDEGRTLRPESPTSLFIGFGGRGPLPTPTPTPVPTPRPSATPFCPNGVVEPGEQCDGDDLAGKTCTTLGMGFTGGDLACTIGCRFATGDCTTCGDGRAEGDEQCDGADLEGTRCENLGFDGGTLTCSASCTFDTRQCTQACEGTVCDDGACAPPGAQCCPGDGYCPPGQVCVGDAKCCPASLPQRCGTLCTLAENVCCPSGGICGPGQVCVEGGCCPANAPQACHGYCIPGGTECCPGGDFCYPGTHCVAGGGCLPD